MPVRNNTSETNIPYNVVVIDTSGSSSWGLANLSPGFRIPYSIGAGYSAWSSAPLIASDSGSGAFIPGNNFEDGVDGYFGFIFDIDGSPHAGWAKINLQLGISEIQEEPEIREESEPSNRVSSEIAVDEILYSIPMATISEWAYESEPFTCVVVGDTSGASDCGSESVPEPTSSLVLLSMGAAGVYQWRKRKQLLAEAEKSAA